MHSDDFIRTFLSGYIKKPFLSIVIPIYNNEAVLSDTLWSLLNQTMSNIEIICVDDGSTDGSPDILREMAALDHRIHILKTPRLGLRSASRRGIDLAHSDLRVTLRPGKVLDKNACMRYYFRVGP